MKNLILISAFLVSITLAGCSNNKTDGADASNERNSTEHVDENSHEEITPQVSSEGDSTLLNVDTVSSSESAEERQKDSL